MLAFLGLYAAMGAIAVVATVPTRRSLARSHAPVPALRLDNPDDIAYLHGGPERTVFSAVCAMHVAGRITSSGRRRVRAAGVVDPAAGELERAVHASAQHPVTLAELLSAPPVAEALRCIERLAVGTAPSARGRTHTSRFCEITKGITHVRREQGHRRTLGSPSSGGTHGTPRRCCGGTGTW